MTTNTLAITRRPSRVVAIGIVGFAVALALASQVAVPIPGTPVPITLQPLVVVLLVPAVGVAQASQPPQTPAATDGFVPVTDLPPAEQLPAAPMVIGAYAFIWVAVLVYVGLLWKRLGVVQKELDALARRIPPRS